ncbi:MAG: hypothetical protein R2754_15430 [Microthrixaceae bacterium]
MAVPVVDLPSRPGLGGCKAGRVLDLYERCWDGHPLGPDDYAISADEKSQLQALNDATPT